MVQLRTVLTVVDNSGVKLARRIQVMKTKKRPGTRADFVVASVLKALPDCSLKKGDLVRGYRVTTHRGCLRPTGLSVVFPSNGLVLITKKGEPLGTRVRVPRPTELRRHGRSKVLSLAPQLV